MNIPDYPPKFETDLVRPFYEGLARSELLMSSCSACGTFHWYPPDVLPCHPEAPIAWRPISPLGTVYTFTRIERSVLPGGAGGNTPYTIVLVEPDDAPFARIPGLFVAADPREPECGLRVRLNPLPVSDHIVAGFAPID